MEELSYWWENCLSLLGSAEDTEQASATTSYLEIRSPGPLVTAVQVRAEQQP